MEQELVRRVVQLADQAPSVRDTRPWRFTATPDGLDLHTDRDRQLPALDPTGRQLVLSCGAALEFARLALIGSGFRCRVELLPDGQDLGHLARLSIGAPWPAAADELALVAAIGGPRPARDRDPGRSPGAVRDRLDRDAGGLDSWLRWVDSAADRAALAALADRADRIQRSDPAVRAELAPRTGLLPAAGPTGSPGPEPAPNGERPGLVVLGTRYDGPTSWLQAGQAAALVLLRAATLDVAAAPVDHVLDLPWTRARLRSELRLPGHPQLVLRLAPARPAVPAPARQVDDVLLDRA